MEDNTEATVIVYNTEATVIVWAFQSVTTAPEIISNVERKKPFFSGTILVLSDQCAK